MLADRPLDKAGRPPSPSTWRRIRENWSFFAFVSPFFVKFAVFGAFPIAASFLLGFARWDGLTPPTFRGIKNYLQLLEDPMFRKVIFNSTYIWLGSAVLTVSLAFLLAFLVQYYVPRGKTLFQTIFLFPLLVAPAVTSLIISVMFSKHAGIINTILSYLSGSQVTTDWLRTAAFIKPLIVLVMVWRWTGFHFVIQMAGLQAIPTELYEAAQVDGATGRQVFRHITFPLMIPVLLFSMTSATIGGLQVFDEPYALTGGTGGPLQAGTSLGMYLYQTAFQEFQFGLSSAMAYVIFAIIGLFSLINSRLLRSRS